MDMHSDIKTSSTIYDRIRAMNMTPAEREVALSALEDAETLVDAFSWVTRKIEQLGALLFLKPSPKH